MKKIRLLLLTFGVLCVVVCCAFQPSFIANCEENKKIVAFGDSITNAYGLDENKGYVSLYATENEMEFSNFAVNGLTSFGLKEKLDNTDYSSELSSADKIFLYIGANDILSIFSNRISPLVNQSDFASTDIGAINTEINSETFKTEMMSAINAFKLNYEEIINKIKEYNKNIILFTIYNPYTGIKIENVFSDSSESLNLGFVAENYIDIMNSFIKTKTEYVVVDVFTAFEKNYGQEKLVNTEINLILEKANFDPHPTEKGQLLIKTSISQSLDQSEKISSSENSKILPIWALTLIIVAGVAIIAVSSFFVIKKRNFICRIIKHKKQNNA